MGGRKGGGIRQEDEGEGERGRGNECRSVWLTTISKWMSHRRVIGVVTTISYDNAINLRYAFERRYKNNLLKR